jgi:hypothetical protein
MQAAHVLHSAMPGSGLFVFGERGLMHHVLLLGARDGALTDAVSLQPEDDSPTVNGDTEAWGIGRGNGAI